MAEVTCGFKDEPPGQGTMSLESNGPTLIVHVGFDPDHKATGNKRPTIPTTDLFALVDTGALESCIDSSLAMQLNLPIVDRRTIAGVQGTFEVNVHLAQVVIPQLNYVINGQFAAVELAAGGQHHRVLIGRKFLRNFTMVYEGKTGSVIISSPKPK